MPPASDGRHDDVGRSHADMEAPGAPAPESPPRTDGRRGRAVRARCTAARRCASAQLTMGVELARNWSSSLRGDPVTRLRGALAARVFIAERSLLYAWKRTDMDIAA